MKKQTWVYPATEKIVDEVISALYDRGGFDNWWDDLDAEIRVELEEIVNEIFFLDQLFKFVL